MTENGKRRKNDLSLFAAHCDICDGRDYREAEYKAMTNLGGMKKAIKEIEDNINYLKLCINTEENKDKIDMQQVEYEIQHVSYDEEQCGRTK